MTICRPSAGSWKFSISSIFLLLSALSNKAKHYWVMSTDLLFSKVFWQCPAMFCLYTSSKLSRQWFEFSLFIEKMNIKSQYQISSIVIKCTRVTTSKTLPVYFWPKYGRDEFHVPICSGTPGHALMQIDVVSKLVISRL